MKLIITKEGRKYLKEDINISLNEGNIKKLVFGKNKTHSGNVVYAVEPRFNDLLKKMKRGPAIVLNKDIGLIITETGINKDSIIVDAGAGTGYLAATLANICKKVTTYENRKEFYNIAKENFEFLNLKNVEIKNKDIYKGIEEKDVDLITLDLAQPEKVLKSAAKALKLGGFLVGYLPTINQVMNLIKEIKEPFILVKTSEVIERTWITDERIRPDSNIIGHTGFLVFIRKVC
ncbi:MAG: rRNA adenine N-6-methyltransferase family protein [Candidatus Nanoarchaeia archaeon]|nr:rRNA adenine N-6-methyltransferase family protein [Candidatus Nanoarchaeia archaeon]